MKLQFEVCRCDKCNKLFEKDFIPKLKIDKNYSETPNSISYKKVDLCKECDAKMAADLDAKIIPEYEHSDSKRQVIFS